jgi:hypothetical protein
MKYIKTHEGFINKVKTFIKDKIKEQEPNTENNITGSEEKQSEFKEFVLDSITYLQDDFTITISFVESSFERGYGGETIHGGRKTETRIKVKKQVRQGDEGGIEETKFIIDDVKDQLLFMVERVIRHYNILDAYFIYKEQMKLMYLSDFPTMAETYDDEEIPLPNMRDLTTEGKSHKLSKEDFEKLSFDTITSEVNVIFKLL